MDVPDLRQVAGGSGTENLPGLDNERGDEERILVSEQFNDLTPAESERLYILMEECGEVIQVIGKILRHGYASTHPDDENGHDNRDLLEIELGHVKYAQLMLHKAEDIDLANVRGSARLKAKKIAPYLHHQGED
jgi:NTP pyrophosphatase (non-canonical NTP hydrolase)